MSSGTISLQDQLSKVLASLDDVARKHVPFAAAQALTRTALIAKDGVRDVMEDRFEFPTPYALNSLRIVAAKKADPAPTAKVYFKDDAFKGTPASKYLTPGLYGGARQAKRFERALIAKGLMRTGQYAIPAAGAQLDRYGNVRRGQIVQILSALRAFGEQGYVANRTQSRRSQRKGAAAQYFVANLDGADGIWQRRKFGFGEGVRPVFVFADSAPQYRVRVPFDKIVNNMANKHFPIQFASALQMALAGAGFQSR